MSYEPSTKDPPWESSFYDRAARERIDLDAVFRALADDCRREILGYLDVEPVWTRERLATRLVQSNSTIDGRTVDHVELNLIHRHLPVMEAANLVALEGEVVERGDDFRVVREMVDGAAAVVGDGNGPE